MKQIYSEITKLAPCKLKIKITVDKSLCQEIYNQCCLEVKNEVQLPGFRKGTAPVEIVRKRFENTIMSNFVEKTINQTLPNVLKENNISYLPDSLKINSTNFPLNDKCSYEVILETEPEFKLKAYKGLKLKKEVRKVIENDIDRTIEELRHNYGKLVPSKKTTIDKQDVLSNPDTLFCVVDYKVFIDGKELTNYAGKNILVNLSSNSLPSGFKEGLIGMSVGEKKNITVKFPDNIPQVELMGKQATFEVELLEIKEKVLPSIEEIVKEVGFSNLEELRNNIKTRLQQEFENDTKRKLKEEIYKILLQEHNFPLPETEVEKHYQGIIDSLKNKQTYTDNNQLTLTDEQQKQLRKKAEDEIKLKYILKKIMEEEKIQITNEELEKEKGKLRNLYPGREQLITEYFEKNLPVIASNLLEDKIIEFIISHAKIKEVDITPKK
ncbi:MAG: trigger factor [Endomicrobia bacterium]|nr:trigger factor [Endomicrobiia bacterium]